MINIKYSLQFHSPFQIGSGVGEAGYIDNAVVRSRSGIVYVPGASVKGNIRAAAHKLADGLKLDVHDLALHQSGCLIERAGGPCVVCSIFGAPQWPSDLKFGNAILPGELTAVLDTLDATQKNTKVSKNYGRQLRTGIGIHRKSRVVVPERLFTNECADIGIPFDGVVSGNMNSKIDPKIGVGLILASFKMIGHLGAGRSRGLGRCQFSIQSVKIDDEEMNQEELMRNLLKGGVN